MLNPVGCIRRLSNWMIDFEMKFITMIEGIMTRHASFSLSVYLILCCCSLHVNVTTLSLIHQPFLGRHFFLKPTHTDYMKNLTFTNVIWDLILDLNRIYAHSRAYLHETQSPVKVLALYGSANHGYVIFTRCNVADMFHQLCDYHEVRCVLSMRRHGRIFGITPKRCPSVLEQRQSCSELHT